MCDIFKAVKTKILKKELKLGAFDHIYEIQFEPMQKSKYKTKTTKYKKRHILVSP